MKLGRILQDLSVTLRFYSRLPVPAPKGETDAFAVPSLAAIAYAVPLAGAVLGLIGGAVLVLATVLHLPPLLAAALAVTALVLATGAFHEDGLADTADGLGGGRDRAAKLAIMRDSRIGSYGGIALILALLLRVTALAALVEAHGAGVAAAVLAAAAGASRAAGLVLLEILPPARLDGAAASAGRPGPDAATACALVAALLVVVLLVVTLGVGTAFCGLIAPAVAVAVMARIARRQIGGQTGDVAGATQQVAEIAFLLAVLIYSSGR